MFRIKYVPGMTWNGHAGMDMIMDLSARMNAPAAPIKEHMDMTMVQTVKSVRAEDGAGTIETRNHRLYHHHEWPDRPTARCRARAQMTQPRTTVMSATGQPLSMDLSADEEKNMSAVGMDPSQFALLPSMFPIAPQTVGETWKSDITLPIMGGFEFFRSCTLANLDSSTGSTVATIDGKGHASFSMDGSLPQMHGMSMHGDITSTDLTNFDTDAGHINSSTTNMDMVMILTPKPAAQASTPGVLGPMKMNMKMSMVLNLVPGTSVAAEPAAK